MFALGGMNGEAVVVRGEWYRLLSAALLHGDLLHLVLNGVALGLAGYWLESLLGSAWLLGLFFLGALGGSLMGLVVNPSNIVSVGASGAVMGLLAAALVTAMRYPRGVTRTQLQMQLLQFLIPSLIPLATHRSEGHTDYAAHFGGAIVGGVSGLLVMKLWPREQVVPRFPAVTKAFALVSVVAFAVSVFLAHQHYPAYAREVAFDPVALLVADGAIPKDMAAAKQTVELWGKDRPRDPRVRFIRALRLLDEANEVTAEQELRAGLAERDILERAFGDKQLERGMRSVLCQVLLQQGRRDEALREAKPVCAANDGSAPAELRELGLCK
jgi:rhomboid protease GluP